MNASIWHVYTYTLIGVKKAKKQDEVKETTEASAGEEQQKSDEKQEEECAESVKFSENGNEKEGSAEEDDSDEDGPQLPSGLTGKHGTAGCVKYSLQSVIYLV